MDNRQIQNMHRSEYLTSSRSKNDDDDEKKDVQEIKELNEHGDIQYFKMNKKITGSLFAVFSTAFSFATMFLIPFHNVFVDPEYIWEAPFLHWFPYFTVLLAFMLYICHEVMDYPAVISPKFFMKLVMHAWICTTIFYSVQYYVWTIYLGFHQPLPQSGPLNAVTILWTIGVTFYFQFPGRLQSDSKFRKRIIWFILYWEWENYMPAQFQMVSQIIPLLGDYVWVVAFIFVIILESNKFLMEKMILKACGADIVHAKRIMTMQLYAQYLFAVVTIISANVDDFTSYLILSMDFSIDLVHVFRIIRSRNKVGLDALEERTERTKRELMTKELILAEAMECIIPVIFIAGFAVAFYGPNYDELGNVGFDYFHYVKVTDILEFLRRAFYMTGIDVAFSIFSIVVLWVFARINMLKESVELVQRYGKMTIWFLMIMLVRVSITNSLNVLSYWKNMKSIHSIQIQKICLNSHFFI